jgi:CBS domain-containing protein
MRCKDIMKKPVVSCREIETIQIASQKMRDSNIGFLPICSVDGRVVGVLTDRDIALRAVADGLDTRETSIARVMTRQVISCRKEHDLRFAEQLMVKNQKSRILVVDEEARPTGVISLSDIAKHDRAFAAETMRQVSTREIRTA